MDGLAEFGLAEVADMRLDRIIAVAGLDVVEIEADKPQQRIGRFAEDLQVAMLGHVAVVVDPGRADLCFNETERSCRIVPGLVTAGRVQKRCLEFLEQLSGTPALAAMTALQGMENADKIFVADAFEF